MPTETPIDELKRTTAITLRALAAHPDLLIKYMNNLQAPTDSEVCLPLPALKMSAKQLSAFRGHADLNGLRRKYTNKSLHKNLSPSETIAKNIFDALEDVRVEALTKQNLPGLSRNLSESFHKHCKEKGLDVIKEPHAHALPEVVKAIVREALTHHPAPLSLAAALKQWRHKITPTLNPLLDRFSQNIADQQAFANVSQQLLQDLNLASDSPAFEDDPEEKGNNEDAQDEQPQQDKKEQAPPQPSESFGQSTEQHTIDENNLNLAETQATNESDKNQRQSRQNSQYTNAGYQAYTTAFDEIVHADELSSPEELSSLRNQLDDHLHSYQNIITRLANRLQRQLMSYQARQWDFDLEDGLVDSSRLARIIANPLQANIYKWEKDTEFRDTVVTILLDNSGSMRGRPIILAAISAEILARTLERCGVKVEILGFTTNAWKGGKSREQWVANNQPANPGRLNDLRHIIYKPADTPWRRAKQNLGLMLREGILKENIDGEALLWAHQRLAARPEARKILMVISDGAPVDDSTLSVNTNSYLEEHLQSVVDWIENIKMVELIAIGIGHDVTKTYARSVTIADADQLGPTMMHELEVLFKPD